MKITGRLLGPLQFLIAGADATPSAPRQRTVLATLIARCGQPVPAETLITSLWAGTPPARAAALLHNYIHSLRKGMSRAAGSDDGLAPLTREAGSYVLHLDARELDSHQFTERLNQADSALADGNHERASELLDAGLALWRGPALSGVPAAEGSPAHVLRLALEEQRTTAFALRVGAALAAGRDTWAVAELRQLVHEYPGDERFQRQLITALSRTGRTSEADDLQRRLPASVPAAGMSLASPPADRTRRIPARAAPPAPARKAGAVMPDASVLRFSVLGPVRAWHGERPLPAGSPQQRAMLAALLLRNGRTITAQELVDDLWGEDPPLQALAAIRTYASRLRKSFGTRPGVLVSELGGYALRLAPGDVLDLKTVTELTAAAEESLVAGDPLRAHTLYGEALDLWDGEALGGVPGPAADLQRTWLAERRLALTEQRIDVGLQAGLHAEAVSELTALTTVHPLRERLRELLMLALYRSGRQAEALAVYADARRVLVDELGVEPRAELAALQQRILHGDASLMPSALPARPPEPAPPQQLPAAVPDFVGRAAFCAELSAQLSTVGGEVVAVSAVAGMGGVGKTTLALQVAHAAREHFPDGQLYVDLQGASSSPADPGTVLGAFLRALGASDSAVPRGVAERAALYRSLLGNRRVLVLLDNARDSAQVRHLLPGTDGCAALITSRVRMVGLAGAHLIDLDVMSPEEALALFSRIVGEERAAAEREAAMDVVAACGFLPLGIRIAASRLAARRTWNVAVLARKLSDERRRLDELQAGGQAVKAAFELGYSQLEHEHARAFRLLGLPDGPDISLHAAAALLDRSAEATETVLETLVDAHLLQTAAPGRYRLHSLVRLFARACAESGEQPPAERDAALLRLLDFYLASAAAAHELEIPGAGLVAHLTPTTHPGLAFTTPKAARDWLFGEAECILACIRQSAGSGQDALRLAADVLIVAQGLAESDILSEPYGRAVHAVLEAAVAAGKPRAEGRARMSLAYLHSISGRFEEADNEAKRSLLLAQSGGDPLPYGRMLNERGVLAQYQQRHDDAKTFLSQALTAFRKDNDRIAEVSALGNLTRTHLATGQTDSAVTLARQVQSLCQELGSALTTGNANYLLGVALTQANRADEALEPLHQARTVFQEHRQQLWEGLVCFRLAEAHLTLADPAQAVIHAEEALTLMRDVGGPWRRARALTVFGRALRGAGQTDRARACWEQALATFTQMNSSDSTEVRELLASLPPLPPASSPTGP